VAHAMRKLPKYVKAYRRRLKWFHYFRRRGFATVRLPREAGPLEPPLEYDLRDLDPPSTARVTAELEDGHFTIATDQPHVKVAWRVSRRQEEPR